MSIFSQTIIDNRYLCPVVPPNFVSMLRGVDVAESHAGGSELVIDVRHEGLEAGGDAVRDEELLALAVILVQLVGHRHDLGLGLLHQLRPARHGEAGRDQGGECYQCDTWPVRGMLLIM